MAAQEPQNELSLPETMESSNSSSTNTTETLKSPGEVTADNPTTTSPPVTDPAKTASWADEVSSPVREAAPPEEIKQTDGASEPLGGNDIVENSKFDVHVKLSDLQANPNDPLYSIKSFEDLGLSENILKGIYQMRFTKPSKIQERALPLLLANPPTNMIGQSQSGTGKTAAFVLNILSRLDMSTPEMQNAPQALCLAPTRELARQIMGVIQLMGSFVEGLGVVPAIPLDSMSRGKELRGQIVVGTPGTVQDLIKKRLLRTEHLKVLVLDEADTMLDMQGLGDQCIRVKK
jgi:ATP-dependent RNA helicase DDX19/DBP5